MKEKMDKLLEQLSEHNHVLNVKLIEKTFGSLFYKSKCEESILHILAQSNNEEKAFFAIKSLLEIGINPNQVDGAGRNFIQSALISNRSCDFILKILKEALKHKLNVNYCDYDYQTIAHTALLSDYKGDVIDIFRILIHNGFNLANANDDNKTIYDILKAQNRHIEYIKVKACEEAVNKSKNDLPNFKLLENSNTSKSIPQNVASNVPLLTEEQLKEFEKFGTVLNYNRYTGSPAIAREKELKNLIITLAQDLASPIIVGESGVGKTALVHELVFRIKRSEVPAFLKDKIVFEINPAKVVAGCNYVGDFEKNMTECMDLCKKYNVIVFIDEIHSIYGVGSSKGKDNDMAQMLKSYLDKGGIKVIGTTTIKEYDKYFNTDALKRRFEKIVINEPEDEVLYKIVDNVLDNYSKNKNIKFENDEIKKKILYMLLNITEKKHRVFDDRINNPSLILSIIDKAFAIALTYDEDIITIEHFIQSIQFNNRIYESAKEDATKYLNSKPKEKTKIIEFIPKNR